jgi:cytochrome c oxidase subunit 4
MTEHVVPKKIYFLVFSALVVLTLTTVRVATIDLGPINTITALVIAACKATLVILFFMHVRYSKRLIWLVVASGLLWVALLIGLTLTDFLSRSWLPSPRGW